MGWFSSSSFTALLPLLLFFLFIFASSLALDHHNPPLISVVDIKRPVLDVTPSVPLEHSAIHGVKDSSLCERVQVKGIPRLKLWSYASSFHVSLAPSAAIPERLHSKIHVCFHRNNSLGWCQCGKHEGRSVQKGIWSAVMSPYETRYVDVRINGQISGSVTVALEEDFQQWRLICLVLGLALLLLAPIVSSKVPYNYGSSMAIGVFVVIIFLLFQGMESLLTGGKYIFYLTICGSMLRAGSFLLCQFYLFVNSILQSLGMSEEMQNPVAVLVRPGIILFLAGAPSGYLFVRIISRENGTRDAGVAQFVKCALRIIGIIVIWQSTIDPPLAVGALVICGALCIKCETSVNDSLKQWLALSDSPVRGHHPSEHLPPCDTAPTLDETIVQGNDSANGSEDLQFVLPESTLSVDLSEDFSLYLPPEDAAIIRDFAASNAEFTLPASLPFPYKQKAYETFVTLWKVLKARTLLQLLSEHRDLVLSHVDSLVLYGFKGAWFDKMATTLQLAVPPGTSEDLLKMKFEKAACAARVSKLQQKSSLLSNHLQDVNSKLATEITELERLVDREEALAAFNIPFSL